MDARLRALTTFYEQMSPAGLNQIGSIYASNVYFKDPFNEVRGIDQVAALFRRMFERVREPHFVVRSSFQQDDQAFLTWEMTFLRGNGLPFEILGATHIRFDASGRVIYHRDYWDTAEELYVKLPSIGWADPAGTMSVTGGVPVKKLKRPWFGSGVTCVVSITRRCRMRRARRRKFTAYSCSTPKFWITC